MLNASFKGKSKDKLPEGAEKISEEYSLRVEEIENGFIIVKNYDIKYKLGESTDYLYYHKTWFSKENPLSIELEEDEEGNLEDNF